MKKVKIIVALCAISVIIATVAVAAAGYDSTQDPFISLSYLEKVFKPQLIEELVDQIGNETGKSSVEYTIEHLTEGQRIEATRSCEIILRSGSATALVVGEENIANKVGLSNITAGHEVLNGENIPLNNYILIPRADGRAVVTKSGEAYYMVRGEYKVVSEESAQQ